MVEDTIDMPVESIGVVPPVTSWWDHPGIDTIVNALCAVDIINAQSLISEIPDNSNPDAVIHYLQYLTNIAIDRNNINAITELNAGQQLNVEFEFDPFVSNQQADKTSWLFACVGFEFTYHPPIKQQSKKIIDQALNNIVSQFNAIGLSAGSINSTPQTAGPIVTSTPQGAGSIGINDLYEPIRTDGSSNIAVHTSSRLADYVTGDLHLSGTLIESENIHTAWSAIDETDETDENTNVDEEPNDSSENDDSFIDIESIQYNGTNLTYGGISRPYGPSRPYVEGNRVMIPQTRQVDEHINSAHERILAHEQAMHPNATVRISNYYDQSLSSTSSNLPVIKNFAYYVNKLEKDLLDNNISVMRVYKDGDLVEVCSPVFDSYEKINEWFVQVDNLAKSNKYIPWKRTKAGGGMHINISIDETKYRWKETYINFFILIANHPELNWMFNEPSDNKTANALILNHTFIATLDRYYTNKSDLNDTWNSIRGCGGKSYALNTKGRTYFELRCFEMVRDPDELYDMVQFVNRLLLLAAEIAAMDIILPIEVEIPMECIDNVISLNGYRITPTNMGPLVFTETMWTATEKFNTLLNDLGLDPKQYSKYVRRNFYVRRSKKYGKTYMQ